MVSPYEEISSKILGSIIESSPSEELLGITIDSELIFHKQITSLCSKANQKPSALARVAKYMIIDKRKIALNSSVTSQFNYCRLIWMCHRRTTLNNKINRVHERVLRIVYNDNRSNFKELLERDHSFTIHKRNIKYLAIEAYNVKNGISPVIMNVFQFGKNSTYELRSGNYLQRTNVQTVHFGSESIKTQGAKIWDLIPEEIKASKSLMILKKNIKIELQRVALVAFAGSILAKLVS